MSPSSPWAWSEMPTVTLPSPSTRAHSWDFMNFRSPGISLMLVLRMCCCRWKEGASLAKEKDRKSTRLNSITNAHIVCRLRLAKTKPTHVDTQSHKSQLNNNKQSRAYE